jgi:hypothetical protein
MVSFVFQQTVPLNRKMAKTGGSMTGSMVTMAEISEQRILEWK